MIDPDNNGDDNDVKIWLNLILKKFPGGDIEFVHRVPADSESREGLRKKMKAIKGSCDDQG